MESLSSSPVPATPSSRERRAISHSRGSLSDSILLAKVGWSKTKRSSSTFRSSSLSSP
ncbi:MAG: hypothetical protein LKE27_07220 [Atopobiaceae bacterium]|nr:hypothetical protein [Atopobiaceae bacterium]